MTPILHNMYFYTTLYLYTTPTSHHVEFSIMVRDQDWWFL